MPSSDQNLQDKLTVTWIELALRLGVLGLLLYWSFILVRPFITIAIWSVVLTVALYPAYDSLVNWLSGRRRLAAILLTVLSLLVVIGPATGSWWACIDSLRSLSEQLDLSVLALPPPPVQSKNGRSLANRSDQFWNLASTNLQAAFAKVTPLLKPLGGSLLQIAAEAGGGAVSFSLQ